MTFGSFVEDVGRFMSSPVGGAVKGALEGIWNAARSAIEQREASDAARIALFWSTLEDEIGAAKRDLWRVTASREARESEVAALLADMQPVPPATHPEARDTMATPVMVPAIERRRLVVAEVGVCPACDHQPHMAGHCAGIRADGTHCACELG